MSALREYYASLSTAKLYELYDLYSDLKSRGVRDEVIQEIIAQELDLREQQVDNW